MSFYNSLIRYNKTRQAEMYAIEYSSKLNASSSLFIHSKTTGSGKTFQALQFVKKWFVAVEAGEQEEAELACFVSAKEVQKAYLKTIKDGKEQENLDNFFNTPLLILDDLGSESEGKSAYDIISDLIVSRYDAKLQTIFTSNLNLSEIAEKYNQRVADRIIEMCGKEGIIQAPEKDFRQSELARPNTLENSPFYKQRMAKIEQEKQQEEERIERAMLKSDPEYQAKVKEQIQTAKNKFAVRQAMLGAEATTQTLKIAEPKPKLDEAALKLEMEKNRMEAFAKLQLQA